MTVCTCGVCDIFRIGHVLIPGLHPAPTCGCVLRGIGGFVCWYAPVWSSSGDGGQNKESHHKTEKNWLLGGRIALGDSQVPLLQRDNF